MEERVPDLHDGWCLDIRRPGGTRSMTHRNSPLTPAGRLRLVERVDNVMTSYNEAARCGSRARAGARRR